MSRYAALVFMGGVTCYLLGRVFVEAASGPQGLVEVIVYGATAAFGLEYLIQSWHSQWTDHVR
jgi:hypothetical protein